MYIKFSEKKITISWYLFSRIDHKDVRGFLKTHTKLWLEEWATVFITDLQCRPSAYEVRRVIYNVDYRSDCLWESCAFNTTGLKGKTERKNTILKTISPPSSYSQPPLSPISCFANLCKIDAGDWSPLPPCAEFPPYCFAFPWPLCPCSLLLLTVVLSWLLNRLGLTLLSPQKEIPSYSLRQWRECHFPGFSTLLLRELHCHEKLVGY